MDTPWRIELLVRLRATQGDRVVTRFRARKTGALLAYLAYHLDRPHPRELLIELFWPEAEPHSGRNNLSRELNSLRRQLEPPAGLIVADRDTVQLNASACTTDVLRFEAAVDAAERTRNDGERVQALAQAIELYRGELLPGYYEEWIVPERERLQELFCQAVRQLVIDLEANGDPKRAVQYAHRAVTADPLREEARHELIRLYAAVGQPHAALRQYQELEQMLRQRFDAAPSAATRALARAAAANLHVEEEATGDSPPVSPSSPAPLACRGLEPVGGAVPLGSPFYIERPTDQEFEEAVARGDSVVLVKGMRQVGKTSLLVRGLQRAREAGARVAMVDFAALNAVHLESAESLLLALADILAEQLELPISPRDMWDARRGPNPNFRRFLEREALSASTPRLVWGLDQIDRLFYCPFGQELFALFRSWHNERAFDPSGPWSRLTLAIAYTTEVHLFIADLDKSPFNVGTSLTLDDFTLEQTAELNRRYGSPLEETAELSCFHALLNGHPYLIRRGLHEMAAQGATLSRFEEQGASDHWIFGDHLRRVLAMVLRDPELCQPVQAVLRGQPCPTLDSFYRVRSAGIVTGHSEADARVRCPLYARYLEQHLP